MSPVGARLARRMVNPAGDLSTPGGQTSGAVTQTGTVDQSRAVVETAGSTTQTVDATSQSTSVGAVLPPGISVSSVAAELAAEGHPLTAAIPASNPNGGVDPVFCAILGLPTDFVFGAAPDPWVNAAAADAYMEAGSYTAWIAEGAPGSGWQQSWLDEAKAAGQSLLGGGPITRAGWGG